MAGLQHHAIKNKNCHHSINQFNRVWSKNHLRAISPVWVTSSLTLYPLLPSKSRNSRHHIFILTYPNGRISPFFFNFRIIYISVLILAANVFFFWIYAQSVDSRGGKCVAVEKDSLEAIVCCWNGRVCKVRKVSIIWKSSRQQTQLISMDTRKVLNIARAAYFAAVLGFFRETSFIHFSILSLL